MSDLVRRWAPYARAAGRKYGIAPRYLLAIIEHESAGKSNAYNGQYGARWLTQFIPSTARSLGVHDDISSIFGAAKYLKQLGFNRDPRNALDHHYGGAGANGYWDAIKSLSQKYANEDHGVARNSPPGGGGSLSAVTRAGGVVTTPGGLGAGLTAALSGSQRPMVPITAPASPTFAASAAFPTGFQGNSLGYQPTPNASGINLSSILGGPSGPTFRHGVVNPMGGGGGGGGGGGAGFNPGGKGVGRFDGKPVAAWIVPILRYARAQGWSGSVNEGVRSLAKQQYYWNNAAALGLVRGKTVARPGHSNHQFTAYPGGAVDVSQAGQLNAILRRSRYRNVLQWAGGADPPHFSHHHGGSY